MSERKYTDEEIVKALECCFINRKCTGCPARHREHDDICLRYVGKEALEMFNSPKAEIERLQEVNADLNESLRLAAEANKDLKAEIEELEYDRKLIFDEGKTWQEKANALQVELDAMRGAANSLKMHYENARAEAIKIFAERLKKSYYDLPTMSDEEGEYDYVCMEALDEFIDNLVAEMTEGE